MNQLQDMNKRQGSFPDITLLGEFIDLDNPRFLNKTNDYTLLIKALTFIIFQEGIPIIYYGIEQGFASGGDPHNRGSLFGHFDTNHILYKFKLARGSNV